MDPKKSHAVFPCETCSICVERGAEEAHNETVHVIDNRARGLPNVSMKPATKSSIGVLESRVGSLPCGDAQELVARRLLDAGTKMYIGPTAGTTMSPLRMT